MKNSTWAALVLKGSIVVAVLAGLTIAGFVVADKLSDDESASLTETEISTSAAVVRTLAVDFEADGVLTFESPISISSPTAGTVTDIADVGTIVESGDVLAVVDDVPIVWLDGEVPAWRTMRSGDVGADVAQLEAALAALGFNLDESVSIDDEFSSATASMIEAWQESVGAPATGRVELGTIIFGGSRDRIATVGVAVGDIVSPASQLMALGTERRIATFSMAPADGVTLATASRVEVQLPDRSLVEARVEDVTRTADSWTITTSFGEVSLPALDAVDVAMTWQRVEALDALTIPSSALLRLDDGSYVVDVVENDELARRRVGIGAAVGTRVEITAGLSAGDVVVIL
jgi:multidrug efflux pump subunit AcrA (membrane-fusion protein)